MTRVIHPNPHTPRINTLLFVTVLLLGLSILSPLTAGDGMGFYPKKKMDDEAYTATWEVRQLAGVEYLNGTHEKLSLFLTVTSFQPGENITIAVPFRTLPLSMSGEALSEKDFKDRYRMGEIGKAAKMQDMEEVKAKFADDFETTFMWGVTSALGGVPAAALYEYHHHTYSDDAYTSGGKGITEEGGFAGGGSGPPKAVQHYEFEGGSIDVYDAKTSGMTAQELVEVLNLSLPEGLLEVFDAYSEHYVALINATSMPPIAEERFDLLKEYAPETLSELVDNITANPILENRTVWDVYYHFDDNLDEELHNNNLTKNNYTLGRELRDVLKDLVFAAYGQASFEGYRIDAVLPLDEGKMYFPLGTSAGWENPIHEIRVVFSLPPDRSLDSSEEGHNAYIDGRHYYLFSYDNANPDFDIEGTVHPSDGEDEALRNQWLCEHSFYFALLISSALLFLIWFVGAFILARVLELKMTPRDILKPKFIALFPLTVLFSIWMALGLVLVYTGRMGSTTPKKDRSSARNEEARHDEKTGDAIESGQDMGEPAGAAYPGYGPWREQRGIDPVLRESFELSEMLIYLGFFEFLFIIVFSFEILYATCCGFFIPMLLLIGSATSQVNKLFVHRNKLKRSRRATQRGISPHFYQGYPGDYYPPPFNYKYPGGQYPPAYGPMYPHGYAPPHPMPRGGLLSSISQELFKHRNYPPLSRNVEKWEAFFSSARGRRITSLIVSAFFLHIALLILLPLSLAMESETLFMAVLAFFMLSHTLISFLPAAVFIHLNLSDKATRGKPSNISTVSSLKRVLSPESDIFRPLVLQSLAVIIVVVFMLLMQEGWNEFMFIYVVYLIVYVAAGAFYTSLMNKAVPHYFLPSSVENIRKEARRDGGIILLLTSITFLLAIPPFVLLYNNELTDIYENASFGMPLLMILFFQWLIMPFYVFLRKNTSNTLSPANIAFIPVYLLLLAPIFIYSGGGSWESIRMYIFFFPLTTLILGSFLSTYPRALQDKQGLAVSRVLKYSGIVFAFSIYFLAFFTDNFLDMYSTRQLVAGVFLFFYGYYLLMGAWGFRYAYTRTGMAQGLPEEAIEGIEEASQSFYALTREREP
ncbi:MAG: hypothetical protein KAU14_01350 [Thermoplasmata archaeon]|nr:hypothetical protein [Thermoplasmata archaeon]